VVVSYLFVYLRRQNDEYFLIPSIDATYISTNPEIYGYEEEKRLLSETFQWARQYVTLFRTFNIRPATGILLFGPPGTGKTLIAKVNQYTRTSISPQNLI
jgi:ATP-dependent 26S proteasome regulatory subunit